MTLELLGGRAQQRDVYRTVPNQAKPAIKNVLKSYVLEGILAKSGSSISFARHTWVAPLRTLLRSVLRANPDLTRGIRRRLGPDGKPLETRDDHKVGLLSYVSFERLLMDLAVQGPMSWATLFGLSKYSAESGVRLYRRLGVLMSRKQGHSHSISLNGSYPVHKELRKLLIAMSGRERQTVHEDWNEPKQRYEVNRLFSQELRTSVLCTLDAHARRGIDGITMARLLPQFDQGSIRLALTRFEKLGVARSYKRGGRVIYTLDRLWQYHGELKSLLHAINETWPQWKNAARLAKRLRSKAGGRGKHK